LLRFMDLMVAKGKAADMPYSPALLLALLLIDSGLSAMALHLLGEREIFASVVFGQALMCGSIAAILWFRSRQKRIVQTLTATSGIQIPMDFMLLCVALLFQATGAPQKGPVAGFIAVLMLVIAVWFVLVAAHVIKQAADWVYAEALLAMFAIVMGSHLIWLWVQQAFLQNR
jgi:hypothetical protein